MSHYPTKLRLSWRVCMLSRVQSFATRLLCPWDFPGKNTGVGCHFLLQGIFPTQGSKQHLLYLLKLVGEAKSTNEV